MPLVLVGAPMGGAGELSPRAVEALAEADVTYGDDLEGVGVADVLARLGRGERVAVVFVAGGAGSAGSVERLVRAASEAGHAVEVVPGPSAAVAALVVSGLPTDRFAVEGFLPPQDPDRSKRLAAVAAERRTVVVHEAPDRLARTLTDLSEVCAADRQIAVSDLSEPQEEVWRGPLADATSWVPDEPPTGQVVLVLEGAPAPTPPDDGELEAALHEQFAVGASPRDAAAAVAGRFGVPRRRAYQLAVGISRRR